MSLTVFNSSQVSEVTNVSSVLPGSLVQSLVTTVVPDGLNVQVLGFFTATADEFHLPNPPQSLKVGQKVKARVLYDLPGTTPPQFVVTLAEHHIGLQPKCTSEGQPLYAAFPVGAVLDSVRVRRVETERGLVVEIQSDQEGFVHVSIPEARTLILTDMTPRFHMSPMNTSPPCRHPLDHGE